MSKRKYNLSSKGIATRRAWQERTRERKRYAEYARLLRVKYGITIEQYEAILISQSGGCAICGKIKEPSGRRLALDHNDVTKQNRGILCFSCNSSIGKFKHNIPLLQKAIEYLRRYECQPNVLP